MYQEKYSLTWHNYSDHLRSMMKQLMTNKDFDDLTLVTEDRKQINATINVLSTCSLVFKDILKKEKNSNQIIYLRGIQFPEMESIMQFIYLGEATFYEERMDEFLAVAKLLEINELCHAGPEMNDEPYEEPEPNDQVIPSDNVEEPIVSPDYIIKQTPKERRRVVVSSANKYECERCQKTYYDSSTLRRHKRSVHEGVKYACNHCDYQTKDQGRLKAHFQNMHEGVWHPCDQFDQQFTLKCNLRTHIKKMHEG